MDFCRGLLCFFLDFYQGWHPEILRGVVLRVGRSLRPRLSLAASESAGEIWNRVG